MRALGPSTAPTISISNSPAVKSQIVSAGDCGAAPPTPCYPQRPRIASSDLLGFDRLEGGEQAHSAPFGRLSLPLSKARTRPGQVPKKAKGPGPSICICIAIPARAERLESRRTYKYRSAHTPFVRYEYLQPRPTYTKPYRERQHERAALCPANRAYLHTVPYQPCACLLVLLIPGTHLYDTASRIRSHEATAATCATTFYTASTDKSDPEGMSSC